ncbi:MAG TPA: hypothetical protein VMU94_11500, partial [Streptosporangiaceae bacterium]|nr:hypothetical protein [Streptosporangiaceae bacterium]
RMSAALLAAGRPHQVLPLSGTTHMPTDTDSQLLRHELAFLAGSLGVAGLTQTYGDNAPLQISRRAFVNGLAASADVPPGPSASSAP